MAYYELCLFLLPLRRFVTLSKKKQELQNLYEKQIHKHINGNIK